MAKRMLLLSVCLLFPACAEKGLVRSPSPPRANGPPKIDGVNDLGGLQVLNGEVVDESRSDGRFTPGEWIAVKGTNLSDNTTQVRLGDTPVPVGARLENGLLVRMPRQWTADGPIELSVETALGRDAVAISPQAYLVVSDTSANALRFFRTGAAGSAFSPGFEPECDAVSFPRAGLHALSRSGAVLYAVGAAKDTPSTAPVSRRLIAVHMGAPDHPAEVGGVDFSSVDGPVGLGVTGDGGHLVLATQTALLVFALADAASPTLVSRLDLPAEVLSEGGISAMALLRHGTAAVLLDALANRLTIVDLSSKTSPRVAGHVTAIEDTLPRLVDLVVDGADDLTLHVIAGPNLRLAKNLFHKFSSELFSHFEARNLGGSRLISYRLSGDTLGEIRTVPLPDRTIPLHLNSTPVGGVLVSTADFNVAKLGGATSVADGVRTAVKVVSDSVHLGAVFHIDPDGQLTKKADGIALFLTMATLPGDGMASLVMRIGVRKFPPSVGVQLSIDTLDENGRRVSEALLRKLSWSFLVPPYTTPQISFF